MFFDPSIKKKKQKKNSAIGKKIVEYSVLVFCLDTSVTFGTKVSAIIHNELLKYLVRKFEDLCAFLLIGNICKSVSIIHSTFLL